MKFLMILLMTSSFQLTYPQISWQLISNLDSLGSVNSLQFDSNRKIYAAANNGLFTSTDLGISWERNLSNELMNSMITDLLLIDTQNLLIGTHDKGILKSIDGGKTWSQTQLNNTWIEKIVLKKNTAIFAATDDKMYKSTDEGINWERISNGFNPFLNVVWSLYITDQGRVLAGTECGLYSTDDNGSNWSFIESFNCGDVLAINGMANDAKILLGGADRLYGIYFSDDAGNSWEYLHFNDTIFNTTSILISGNNDFYIGAKISGIYKYNVLENTLTSLNSGLPHSLNLGREWYFVSAIAMDSLGYLYLAASNLYRSREPVDSLKYIANNFYDFSLSQNYPNPFNPSTSIQYAVGNRQYVSLKVFDVLGNEIATLVNEEKPAGTYEVTFDANGLSSGMYFYTLKSGGFSKTGKMVLVK